MLFNRFSFIYAYQYDSSSRERQLYIITFDVLHEIRLLLFLNNYFLFVFLLQEYFLIDLIFLFETLITIMVEEYSEFLAEYGILQTANKSNLSRSIAVIIQSKSCICRFFFENELVICSTLFIFCLKKVVHFAIYDLISLSCYKNANLNLLC